MTERNSIAARLPRSIGYMAVACLVFAATFTVAQSASASHKWICSGDSAYEYIDRDIRFYDGTSGDYSNMYMEEARSDTNSWENKTIINLTKMDSMQIDQIRMWAGYYGDTSWAGLATIEQRNGCIIQVGKTQLNKTYLENSAYGYTRALKKAVACQELGHLLGLDHNRVATDTCMNDRMSNPPHSGNQHDYDLIDNIYQFSPA